MKTIVLSDLINNSNNSGESVSKNLLTCKSIINYNLSSGDTLTFDPTDIDKGTYTLSAWVKYISKADDKQITVSINRFNSTSYKLTKIKNIGDYMLFSTKCTISQNPTNNSFDVRLGKENGSNIDINNLNNTLYLFKLEKGGNDNPEWSPAVIDDQLGIQGSQGFQGSKGKDGVNYTENIVLDSNNISFINSIGDCTYKLSKPLEKGKKYTLSVKGNTPEDEPFYFITGANINNSNDDIKYQIKYKLDTPDTWGTDIVYHKYIDITEDLTSEEAKYIYIGRRANIMSSIYEVKLEEGINPSPLWTPAYKDMMGANYTENLIPSKDTNSNTPLYYNETKLGNNYVDLSNKTITVTVWGNINGAVSEIDNPYYGFAVNVLKTSTDSNPKKYTLDFKGGDETTLGFKVNVYSKTISLDNFANLNLDMYEKDGSPGRTTYQIYRAKIEFGENKNPVWTPSIADLTNSDSSSGNGTNGAQGAMGPQGVQGRIGSQGVQGRIGNQGSVGAFPLTYSTSNDTDIFGTSKSNGIQFNSYVDFPSGAGNSGSDMRFKENVKPITNVLDEISKLDIIEYTWNKSGELKDTFGVNTTQLLEFGKYFAKIVHERNDEDKTKWVEYDRFGVLAIKAIQELYEIVKNQQTEINILKSK